MERDTLQYELRRSARRTVSLEIRPDGSLLVRAPRQMGDRAVRAFVASRRDWVEKHRAAAARRQEALAGIPPFTPEQLQALAAQARQVLPRRAAYFAPLVGVRYGRITIRCQRTRWGSCSAGGNLSFNCLLALAPPEVVDYVVVHELCHRKQMNHSPAFWREVAVALPDYPARREWLKMNGPTLLARLPDE